VAPAAIPGTVDLRIHPVRMLGYNGSIRGPTLRMRQGSEITVNATSDGDVETAPCTDAA
jgi:hypothetical protein